MARKARLRSNNRIYHILLRGKDSQDIFLDDEDKVKMMQILKEKKQEDAFFLYSFCILNNHIHIIIREINDDVSRIFKRAATSYAFYFNKKYNKSGRVFQDRFKSEALDKECLLPAIRFVHQNPIKAGLGDMEAYRWSSYQEYIGKAKGPTDCSEILDMISDDTDYAVREFIRFSNDESDEPFLEIITDKEIDNQNVYEYIDRFLKDAAMKLEDLKKPESKKIRDSIILYLMDNSNLSKRRIAEILGINRETVRKAGLHR
jgi:Transposase and inactivated derivatives